MPKQETGERVLRRIFQTQNHEGGGRMDEDEENKPVETAVKRYGSNMEGIAW